MKSYMDRLRGFTKEQLENLIARQKSEIKIAQADLERMELALAEKGHNTAMASQDDD